MMQVGKDSAPDEMQCMGCRPVYVRDLMLQDQRDVVDLHLPDRWYGRTDVACLGNEVFVTRGPLDNVAAVREVGSLSAGNVD